MSTELWLAVIALIGTIFTACLMPIVMKKIERKHKREDNAAAKDAEVVEKLNAAIDELRTMFTDMMGKLTFVTSVAAKLNHESLVFRMDRHISAGWICIDDKTLCRELHEDHKKLGFNGKCDARMEVIEKLPNVPPKKNDGNDEGFNRRRSDVYEPEQFPSTSSHILHNNKRNQKLWILIVDDDVSALTTATHVLKDEYKVTTVKTPQALKEALPKIHPNLILLDFVLGKDENGEEVTGLDMIPIIRGFSQHAEVPIVMLTAMADSETHGKAQQYGVVDFITKPFIFETLLQTVEKHI